MGAREPLPTWYFAMVVVRQADRFALVREKKHGQRWYFPAGRVEPGETLVEGALRETLKEAGIAVRVRGVLRVEHTPQPGGTVRVRVFFLAEPADGAALKSQPDEHSLEARWFTIRELAGLDLRGEEVLECLTAVLQGTPVMPLSLLTTEGASWDLGDEHTLPRRR